MKRGPKPKSVEERFWRHVRKTSGCWLWTGALNRDGEYGQMQTTGKSREQAHRVAYKIYHGRIPSKKKVLHTCDRRICVRKEHLYAGTNKQNTKDMISRGRARWVGAGVRKLTPTMRLNLCVLARMGKPARGLARKFGVSVSTVKYWKERATGPLPR